MSVIVAVWDEQTREAVLAVDSIALVGWSKFSTDKGYLIHGLAWGFSGCLAQGQRAVRYLRSLQPPPTFRTREDVEVVVEQIYHVLMETAEKAKRLSGVSMCVATPFGALHVGESGCTMWLTEVVAGAGDDHAQGALFVMRQIAPALGIEERARRAVEAAIAGSAACAAPVHIFRIQAAPTGV